MDRALIQSKCEALDAFNNVGNMLGAWTPSEPVYCLYPARLTENVKSFLSGLPGRTLYAVKSNPHPQVVSKLYEAGIRDFDAASLAEIELISELCPHAKIYFMAPVKIRDTARRAYHEFGVRHFVVDHLDALENLLKEIESHDSTIFVRMAAANPDAIFNLSSKFGATPAETIKLLERVNQSGAEPALAFNVGSLVRRPDAYEAALETCCEVLAALDFPIRLLDAGGGFPVPYPGLKMPGLESYFDVFRRLRSRLPMPPDGELLVEPGRSLVASSMSVVTEVLLRKDKALYLNDGAYGSFWELAATEKMHVPTRVHRLDGELSQSEMEFTLYGPTCCSTDVLPQKFALPQDIGIGDWIEFGLMGAYSLCARSGFNGFYPDAMVEISESAEIDPGSRK